MQVITWVGKIFLYGVSKRIQVLPNKVHIVKALFYEHCKSDLTPRQQQTTCFKVFQYNFSRSHQHTVNADITPNSSYNRYLQ